MYYDIDAVILSSVMYATVNESVRWLGTREGGCGLRLSAVIVSHSASEHQPSASLRAGESWWERVWGREVDAHKPATCKGNNEPVKLKCTLFNHFLTDAPTLGMSLQARIR